MREKQFKIIRGSLVFLPIAAFVLICIRGLLLAVRLHYSFWSMKVGAIFLACSCWQCNASRCNWLGSLLCQCYPLCHGPTAGLAFW